MGNRKIDKEMREIRRAIQPTSDTTASIDGATPEYDTETFEVPQNAGIRNPDMTTLNRANAASNERVWNQMKESAHNPKQPVIKMDCSSCDTAYSMATSIGHEIKTAGGQINHNIFVNSSTFCRFRDELENKFVRVSDNDPFESGSAIRVQGFAVMKMPGLPDNSGLVMDEDKTLMQHLSGIATSAVIVDMPFGRNLEFVVQCDTDQPQVTVNENE